MESLIESSFERIPLTEFGSDHWSTLAYLETVMVEYGEYQVDLDPRMRTNRRHYRLLAERNHLARHVGAKWKMVRAMQSENGSRLSNGSTLDNHDDWDCVEYLISAGVLTVKRPHNRPTLYLTDLGEQVVVALRGHKRNNGRWATFSYSQSTHNRQAN